MPAKEPKREFKGGDKIRVNLHRGKIEDAVVRAVIQHNDGLKLQVTKRRKRRKGRVRMVNVCTSCPVELVYGFREKLTDVFSGR